MKPDNARSLGTALPTERSVGTGIRYQGSAVAANRYRASALAQRQFGVVEWAQLRHRGMAKAALTRAIASERLFVVHPRVYSVVHPSLMTVEAWHAAAILAGGTEACLCSHSAGWWAGVLAQQPDLIHVATRHDRIQIPGVRWHRLTLEAGERGKLRRMPITAPARIPLDLAADLSLWELKKVLAELEYLHDVHPSSVILRPGYRGARRLREAIDAHTPELADTRSRLEEAFVEFLVTYGFALPEFNHPVGRSTVDAVYADLLIVIELDGVRGHSGERRLLRDHRRDLHRRADGLLPLRYHYAQITSPTDAPLIAAELERLGVPRLTRRGVVA